MVKIGLVQTKLGQNLEENLQKTSRFVKQAARRGAEIVCLPELFAHPYFAQSRDERSFALAEPVPGRLSSFLAECASANRIFLIGGGVFLCTPERTLFHPSLFFG